MPPAALANIGADSDGYLWIKPDKFHESFCQDLTPDEALVMAVTQKAPLASTFGDSIPRRRGREAVLVPGVQRGPDDSSGEPEAHGRADKPAEDHHFGGQPRLAGVEARRRVCADRDGGGARTRQGLAESQYVQGRR